MMRKTFSVLGLILASAPAFAEDAPAFTLPAVEVQATSLPALKELDPVGQSKQPVWTTVPRFSFSQVYALPEGVRTASVNAVSDFGFDTATTTALAETVDVGLGQGWQVGVSFLQDRNSTLDSTELGGRLEVRKAVAPWGEIWGNPTVAASYSKLEEGRDTLKLGALLGGNVTDQVSWTLNGSWSHGFDASRINRFEVSGGAMYALIDNRLTVGLEAVAEATQTHLGADNYENGVALYAGPSAAWRPTGRITVTGAALVAGVRGNDRPAHPRLALGLAYNF